MTIIATLAAPISASFDSFTLISWIGSAYLIANAGFQPLSGKVTDIYGRRPGLIFANTFFAAGNLICGLAKKEWVMIFGRVVAGAGGGCLNTISTFIASDLIPLRERGVWQGFANLSWGLGASLGGVFGGWINDTWGWRTAFLVQVPLVIIAGSVAVYNVRIPVKITDKSRIKRVDFLGAILLVTSLVLLLLGLNSGGNIVPWKHPLIYTTLPLAGLGFVAFVYVEDRVAAEPIIPVRLLLNRTVAAGCLTNWFGAMCAFCIMYYAPLYFQARGLSAAAAGTRYIPFSVGAMTGSLSTGLIMRATGRYRYLNIAIMTIWVTSSAFILAVLKRNTSTWPPEIIFFFFGQAYAGMLTVTLLALISAVEHKHQAVITSASYAFRSTGSTLGITFASAVFQNVLKSELWEKFGGREGAAEVIKRIRNSTDELRHLPAGWESGVMDAYMDAFRGVWGVTLALCVLAAVSSLFMRENVLHTKIDRK